MKTKLSLPLFLMLISTTVLAVNKNESNIENMRQGGDFYKTSLDLEKKKNEKNYLKLIYEENKKQTKIQEQILDILKRKMDPQPREITKEDGTKCIANSSPDCFDYASLIQNHPEVNKIPVLKEFLSDPYDMEKAGDYLLWQQGKLMPYAFDVGHALQMVQAQYGDKVNPLAMNRPSFNSSTGVSTSKLIPEAKKKYLEKIKDFSHYIFFIGYNTNLDILSASNIAAVMLEHPNLKYSFYFADKKSEELFNDLIKNVYANNLKAYNSSSKEVNKKMFDDFGVLTTPSLAISYKNPKNMKRKAQVIANGRIDENMFVDRVFNFLEFNKFIELNEFSDSKLWNSDSGKKYTQEYYKNKFNVEVLNDDTK